MHWIQTILVAYVCIGFLLAVYDFFLVYKHEVFLRRLKGAPTRIQTIVVLVYITYVLLTRIFLWPMYLHNK